MPGAPSPGVVRFEKKRKIRAGSFESDSLQSEQGDRFLGKYNRAAMVSFDSRVPPKPGAAWRWFPARSVISLLLHWA